MCSFKKYRFCLKEAQGVVVETDIKIDIFGRSTRVKG